MKRSWIVCVACVLAVQSAFAGSPLKGIDVKLGRNPGGGCSARTSDANGNVNFGVWPKGNYTVALNASNMPVNARVAKPAKLHIEIHGAVQGTITHVLPAADADGQAPIELVSDGKTPIIVSVNDGGAEPLDAAHVKSHSNTNNN